uniref:Uncharacterized protein n=1 Tax=Pristionchus pacificus TaxID=54126 RepID=A0A2A6BBT3_PRIPA|eukprot:PDM63345.1 hypothetical protein PRIPAC_53702 [Pristionchus pacificus]
MSLEEWLEIVTEEELKALGLVISELPTPSYIAPPCLDLQLYREEEKKKVLVLIKKFPGGEKKMIELKDITPLPSTTLSENVECEDFDTTPESDIGSEKIAHLRAERSTR